MASRSLLIWVVVPCLAAACGKTNLDSRDAGRDTSGPDQHAMDAAHDSGGTDVPAHPARDGAADATPDGPALAGARAFDVVLKLTPTPPLSVGFAADFPTSAMATLVLDRTAGWLLVGAQGEGSTATVAPSAGGLAAATPVSLDVPYGGACQGVATLQFNALKVMLDGDGNLHGTATGFATYYVTDVGYSQAVSATLDGVPDTTRPVLPIPTAGALDPLVPARLAVSEPLPAAAKAQLVGADGTVVELSPELPQSGSPFFVTAFRVPYVLPFGGSFHLAVGGVVDFAGNQASPPNAPLVTLAASPLLTDGGFESTAAGMLGDALIFGAGELPVISGTQSLSLGGGNGPPWQSGGTVTFRLTVAPGDKAVRFSYRVVSMYQGATSFLGTVLVGSTGSKPVSAYLPTGTPTTTVVRASGGTSIIGPVASAEIPLPDPSATEVVLRISTLLPSCGGPLPPGGGLILDDVRVGP